MPADKNKLTVYLNEKADSFYNKKIKQRSQSDA